MQAVQGTRATGENCLAYDYAPFNIEPFFDTRKAASRKCECTKFHSCKSDRC